MKRLLFISCFIVCLISYPAKALISKPIDDYKKGLPNEYTPIEGSVEELYKDIIVTLIEPYITNEITNYYGRPLGYDLFNVKFLNIDRPIYRSFDFTIKLEVRPFVGAHNTIGIDEITIRINPIKTEVIDFKHIKSFPIPPHLKEYYKDLNL